MTNPEAFVLASLQDLPEPARPRGPRYSVIIFDRAGAIQEVYRDKRAFKEEAIKALLKLHPECLHIAMEAGSCRLERTMNRTIRRAIREAKPAVRH